VGIISWIIFGLIAGIIAKLLMPGRDPGGCIVTMLLGVAGAFVGGFLYRLVTGTQMLYFGFDFRSLRHATLSLPGEQGQKSSSPSLVHSR
jgi:uncharacterized membrane protein YeaQ/YmgE (transglycosylase-associated protein family)